MSSTDSLNQKLQSIFTNGRIEVGLEVGSDQGLNPDQYIRIPECFDKDWAYSTVAKPSYRPDANEEAANLRNKDGWTFVKSGEKHVRVHKGKYHAVNPDGTNPIAMELFHRPAFTVGDVKQFLHANNGHVRDNELSVDQRQWAHTIRFWAVVSGFVTGSKQQEWIKVADSAEAASVSNEDVSNVVSRSGEAITASAARAASWRKSNHATGGDIASGFSRRWISKNSTWPTPTDATAKRREQGLATSMFYVGTHASCVHPVLAMLAPSVDEHWAILNPCFGMITSWDVKESTQIRITPQTQVAGTAIVVDSMVVLKMLVMEGLVPLVSTIDQATALVAAFKVVEANGIRAATYAGWFLNGHPEGVTKVSFAQKDASFSGLVGELATVARTFYRNSTIGESLALDNAMQQLASESSKTRWQALTKARKSASDETIMNAYVRISGASASTALQNLVSSSTDDVREGVAQYNNTMSNIAQMVGIKDPTILSIDRIIANMDITPSTSEE